MPLLWVLSSPSFNSQCCHPSLPELHAVPMCFPGNRIMHFASTTSHWHVLLGDLMQCQKAWSPWSSVTNAICSQISYTPSFFCRHFMQLGNAVNKVGNQAHWLNVLKWKTPAQRTSTLVESRTLGTLVQAGDMSWLCSSAWWQQVTKEEVITNDGMASHAIRAGEAPSGSWSVTTSTQWHHTPSCSGSRSSINLIINHTSNSSNGETVCRNEIKWFYVMTTQLPRQQSSRACTVPFGILRQRPCILSHQSHSHPAAVLCSVHSSS